MAKKGSITDKLLILILIVLIVLLANKFLLHKTTSAETNQTKEVQKNILTEADIKGREVFVEAIHHKGCEQCFPTENVFGYLTSKGLNLTIDERYYEDSDKDKELIKELGVTKLPVVLLSGNIDGLETVKSLSQFKKKGKYLVLEAPQPPFYYLPDKKIIGYVNVTYLKDPECKLCPKIGQLLVDMQWKMGVGFTQKKAVYPNMTEFKELVEKYDIKKVPTFIFTGDLLEYENIKKYWDKVGTIEPDGALVLRLVNPPYTNPQTGEIEGLVDVTFLAREEDKESLAKQAESIRSKYRIVYGKSQTIALDSEEGKELAEKYGLNKSAVIFSKEAQLYNGLMTEINDTGLKIMPDGKVVLSE